MAEITIASPLTSEAVEPLRERVRGRVLCVADEGYDEARMVHNGMFDRRPLAIVMAGTFDRGALEETPLERIVPPFAIGEREAPAVVVDDDVDVVRIVERRGGPFVRRVVEFPLGRCLPPDELVEFPPVRGVALLFYSTNRSITVVSNLTRCRRACPDSLTRTT